MALLTNAIAGLLKSIGRYFDSDTFLIGLLWLIFLVCPFGIIEEVLIHKGLDYPAITYESWIVCDFLRRHLLAFGIFWMIGSVKSPNFLSIVLRMAVMRWGAVVGLCAVIVFLCLPHHDRHSNLQKLEKSSDICMQMLEKLQQDSDDENIYFASSLHIEPCSHSKTEMHVVK